MNQILLINKPVAKTPLEVIHFVKEKIKKFKNEKFTYAGRLDPMAEGLLLLLYGQNLHNKNNFLNLNKEYQAQIVLGINTDSYDALGLPTLISKQCYDTDQIKNSLLNYIGNISLQLPPYSSKPVNGKPLFWWAQNNKLNDIEIPIATTQIFDIKDIKFEVLPFYIVKDYIIKTASQVNGDFRQTQIIDHWQNFNLPSEQKLQIINFTISCSSGTYIRSIANKVGIELDSGAFLLKLKRTKIGPYNLEQAIDINLLS